MPPPTDPKGFISPLLQKVKDKIAQTQQTGGAPAAVLTAVLDEGIAFAHERFRVGNQTRIVSFWNQAGLAGPPPQDLFGTEILAAKIDAAVAAAGQDEEPVYRTLGELNLADPDFKALAHRRSHGTHVLDLAAGADPDPATAPRQRPIVAVQMPEAAIADTSGTTLTAYKLLGFMYALRRAQQLAQFLGGDVPVVVNLSYGTYDGPHDGSGLLEKMMDQLTALCAGSATSVRFIVAAGNHRQARVHAHFSVANRRSRTLRWRLQPDDRTPNLLQIWLPKSTGSGLNQHQVRVTLKSPTGGSLVVDLNKPSATGTGSSAAYISEVAGRRACIELRTEPTAPATPMDRSQPTAPAGLWIVKIAHMTGGTFECDAYIQRDDTLVGRRSMGRQSYFEDPNYASYERLEASGKRNGRPKLYDRPPPNSDVRRVGTLNGDGTGTDTYVIGAYRRTPQPWNPAASDGRNPCPASFTSSGPPAANATRTMPSPNWLMPADDSLVCRGVMAAGTRSGVRVSMSGTSVAAPQAARYVADQLEAGNVPGTAAPTGLFPVCSDVPASDRPLVGGWGCMDFPPSKTRARP